jgi:hypothetical protein
MTYNKVGVQEALLSKGCLMETCRVQQTVIGFRLAIIFWKSTTDELQATVTSGQPAILKQKKTLKETCAVHNCGAYLPTWELLIQEKSLLPQRQLSPFETSIQEHASVPKIDKCSKHRVRRGSSEESVPYVESTAGLGSQAPTW